MPTTLTTGRRLPTTTTRTTATDVSRSSHLPIMEHVTIEEVFDAYFVCRRHKRRKASAVWFEMDFVSECYKLYQELNSGMYKIGPSIAFCVTVPKVREVFAADFRDRIVHHLIINKFGDLFEKSMTNNSYACRKGKGTLFGVNRLQRQMNIVGKDGWYARCDIQGFFMSINRDILFAEIERILRRNNTADVEWWLSLIRQVVYNRPELNCEIHGNRALWDMLPRNKSLFHSDGIGLPIGNLTSQVFANVYLSVFDRWVQDRLGDRGAVSRYVDDFIILHPDKNVVLGMVPEIRKWLRDNLELEMHPKKLCIQRIGNGVRFIGVYVRQNCMLPSRRLVEGTYRLIEDSKEMPADKVVGRMNSRFGLMIHYSSYMLRRRLWRRLATNDNGRFININHKKLKERKQK